MAGRYRIDVISDQSEAWSWASKYSTTSGTCTADPSISKTRTWKAGSGVSDTLFEQRSMTDVVTPDFHKKVAQGFIINNPLIQTYERLSNPLADIHMTFYWGQIGCTPSRLYTVNEFETTGNISIDGTFGSNAWIPSPTIDITSLQDQAIALAWSNVDLSEMLALASLKEMNQTVSGLTYILKKVCKILFYIYKMRLKQLAGELSPSELKEIYLNARYNLRPLMYDVQAIQQVLNAPLAKAMRRTFRGNLSRSASDNDSIQHQFMLDIARDWKITLNRSVHREVSVRAGVLTDCKPVSTSQLLGIDQIVETVWDLVPFSFIVDWFCNAGDVISAWTPNLGTTALASWVTVEDTVTHVTTIGGSDFVCTDYSFYKHGGVSSSISHVTATRIVSTKTRTPDYSRPTFPSFRLNLDPLKLLDLGLILTNLKKFKYSSQ